MHLPPGIPGCQPRPACVIHPDDEISAEEHQLARQYVIKRYGDLPTSLARVEAMGGRFGMPRGSPDPPHKSAYRRQNPDKARERDRWRRLDQRRPQPQELPPGGTRRRSRHPQAGGGPRSGQPRRSR